VGSENENGEVGMRNAECGNENGEVGIRNFSISDFGLTEKEKVNHGMTRRITEKEE